MSKPFNPLIRDLTYQEIPDPSIFEKGMDFATKGTVGAVTSAVVSMYNSGVALGNHFGQPWEKADTSDILYNLGLEGSHEYYQQNKDLVDAAGFIGGMFAPGMLGVKALKGTQALLKGTPKNKVAGAIQKALIPTDHVQIATRKILSGNKLNHLQGVRYGLIKQGLHQQALEAAAFELMVLGSMNQSPFITDADVSYLDAVRDNLGAAGVGLLAGAGIGGAVQYATGYAALRKISGDFERKGTLSNFIFTAGTPSTDKTGSLELNYSVPNGDVLAGAVDRLRDLKLVTPGNANPTQNAQRIETQQSIVRQTIDRITGFKGKTGSQQAHIANHFQARIDEALENQDFESVAAFAGLDTLKIPIVSDERYLAAARHVQPVDHAKSIEWHYLSIKRSNPAVADDLALKLAKQRAAQSKGVVLMDRNEVFARTWNPDDPIINSGIVKAELIENLEKHGFHEAIEFTMFHEMGHLTTPGLPAFRKMFFEKGVGAERLIEAEKLSRLARADAWATADEYAKQMRLLESSFAGGKKAMPAGLQKQYTKMEEFVNYMNDEFEIFADAWAVMGGHKAGVSIKQAAKIAPNLLKNFHKHRILDQKFNGMKQLFNLKTGKLSETGTVYTIADLGRPTMSGQGKTISFGREVDPRGKAVNITGVFNPYTIMPLEANAHYVGMLGRSLKGTNPENVLTQHAKANKGIIGEYDFPKLDYIYEKAYTKQPVEWPIKISRKDKPALELDNVGELHQYIYETKAKVAFDMRGRVIGEDNFTPYSAKEIAMLLNTSEDFAIYAGDALHPEFNPMLTGKGIKEFGDVREHVFYSMAWDISTPEHAIAKYSRKAYDEDGMLHNSLAAAQSRIAIETQERVEAALRYMGDRADRLPPNTLTSRHNWANGITEEAQGARLATANHGNYDETSFAQTIGNATTRFGKEDTAAIQDKFMNVAVAIRKSKEAITDLAGVDSLLRQADYEWAPELAELTDVLTKSEIKKAGFRTLDEVVEAAREGQFTAQQVMDRIKFKMDAIEESGLAERLKSGRGIMKSGAIDQLYRFLDDAIEDTPTALGRINNFLDNSAIVEVRTPEVHNFLKMYQSEAVDQYGHRTIVASFKGKRAAPQRQIIRAPRFNTLDYQHFMFVRAKDTEFLANNRPVMVITAKNAEILEEKRKAVVSRYGADGVEVITNTRGQLKELKKMQRVYDQQEDMADLFMRSDMANQGIFSDIAPTPRETLVTDYVDSLVRGKLFLNDEYMALHYADEVSALKFYEREYDELAESVLGKQLKSDHNPFGQTMRIMFAKNNLEEYKNWRGMQDTINDIISDKYKAVTNTFRVSAKLDNWESMNETLKHYGMKDIYTKEMQEWITENAHVARPIMSKVVTKVNSALATGMLRLDWAHSIVNSLSIPIMTAPEITALTKRLTGADQQRLGKLFESEAMINGEKIVTKGPMRIMSQAMKELFTDTGQKAMKEYRELGLITHDLEDYMKAMDELGNVNSADMLKDPKRFRFWEDTGLRKAIDVLATPVDKSEQIAKYIAARSADIILETAGVTGKERLAALSTFVARTNGNYVASQRPTVFQGWAGGAIGLFQTYVFNFYQQFFRHVGDKNKRGIMTMAALQGGIFGAQSMPGFGMLNTAIAMRDRKDGSIEDIYSFTENNIPDVAEFLLYGLGSQLTTPFVDEGISFHTRGNLNPHNATILPSSVWEIPGVDFIANTVKMVGAVTSSAQKGSGVGEAVLHGLAHNSINRPLRGIAQLVRGERTTSKGGLMHQYDEWNAALLTAKFLGTSPMNEAIAVEAYYRTDKFKTLRREKLNSLGRAVKLKIAGDDRMTRDEIHEFARKYKALGGKVEHFQQWINRQLLGASEEQYADVLGALNDSYGLYLQATMGADVHKYYLRARKFEATDWQLPEYMM